MCLSANMVHIINIQEPRTDQMKMETEIHLGRMLLYFWIILLNSILAQTLALALNLAIALTTTPAGSYSTEVIFHDWLDSEQTCKKTKIIWTLISGYFKVSGIWGWRKAQGEVKEREMSHSLLTVSWQCVLRQVHYHIKPWMPRLENKPVGAFIFKYKVQALGDPPHLVLEPCDSENLHQSFQTSSSRLVGYYGSWQVPGSITLRKKSVS